MIELKVTKTANMYWIQVVDKCHCCDEGETLFEENTVSELLLKRHLDAAIKVLKADRED